MVMTLWKISYISNLKVKHLSVPMRGLEGGLLNAVVRYLDRAIAVSMH